MDTTLRPAMALLVMALGVGCATAQPAGQPSAVQPSAKERLAMEAAFARADGNGDGRLTRAEAAHLPAIEARFEEMDTNKDGVLSFDEFVNGAMTT